MPHKTHRSLIHFGLIISFVLLDHLLFLNSFFECLDLSLSEQHDLNTAEAYYAFPSTYTCIMRILLVSAFLLDISTFVMLDFELLKLNFYALNYVLFGRYKILL